MRKYEILAILEPKLDKTAQDKLINEVEKNFLKEIVQKDSIGLKKLAYEINKNQEGIFVVWYAQAMPEKIAELKRHFNLTKGLMRSVILLHEEKFPFEMARTTKDVKFPERKPMDRDGKFFKKPFNRDGSKVEHKTEHKTEHHAK